MRYKYLLLLVTVVVLFSCKKHKDTTIIQPPAPVIPPVLLKDMVIPNLPSPYYHFEYNDAGKPIFASFASDFTRYDIMYSGNRVSEMRNNIIINKDRLQYTYDDGGRVTTIMYADSMGVAYKRVSLSYDGQKLIKLERARKLAAGFNLEKTMTFTYHPDGNLLDITQHFEAINGSPATTVVDRFEQYDTKFNTDAFGLLHTEFFDHFVFMPDLQLQKNNPGKLTRSGDGIHYQITYNYTYNDRKAPLTKTGTGLWLSGPDAGQAFQSNSIFTYY
jgi:hypothetical protein